MIKEFLSSTIKYGIPMGHLVDDYNLMLFQVYNLKGNTGKGYTLKL